MKPQEFSVEAKNLEYIKVTVPDAKRAVILDHLHKQGWYVSCSGPAGRGSYYYEARREDTVHEADTLRSEVEYDLGRL